MAKVHPIDTELVEKPSINIEGDVNTNNEVQNVPDQVSITERLWRLVTFFTVEPFLLCYLLPSVISAVTVQKLNMEKACRSDLGQLESLCTGIIASELHDDHSKEILDLTQKIVADMMAWKQPIQSGIPAIVILFVGAWSDKTGNRKALMLIPILGEFLTSLGLMLTTYYFEWPLWITGLIEALPTALTGGLSIALMGSYSFIADVTTLESRTFRIGLVAVIVTLGVPIGSAISGVLTEAVGYYGIFSINLVFYGFGLIYTYFRIHDVKKETEEGSFLTKLIEFFNPKNAWDTFSLLFLSRGLQLILIILVICAHIVIIGPVFGESAVFFLYMLNKYSMNIIDFSFFTTYVVLLGLTGTALAVTVFSKLLKMHDAIIGIIATTSRIAGNFMYAFAPTRPWLYTAPLIDIFGNTGSTAIRSLGTKIVRPEQVGKMCSLIGFVEAVVPVVYTPLYSKVYELTLDWLPGTFYILGGSMTVPALFIFIAIYYMQMKQQRNAVTNPEEKERYTYENAVTVL